MSDQKIVVGPVLASIVRAIGAFDYLEQVMGPDLARKAWRLIQAQKRGPKGPRQTKENSLLLKIYDHLNAYTPEHMQGAKRRIAAIADNLYPRKYGNSAAAIQKQLTRLLKKRSDELDKQLVALAASMSQSNAHPE